MTAARVHALMAAALEDPTRLECWRRDPERVRQFGIDPCEVDWQGLWHFAGLTAKVRHNPLRAELPLTFRVLKTTALEIELFSHYAPAAARLRAEGKNSNDERIEALGRFLADWADSPDQRKTLIWDAFRHEVAIRRLRATASAAARSPSVAKRIRVEPGAVPQVRGTLILQRLSHDPRLLQERVSGGSLDLESLITEECLLGYWADVGGPPRLLRLDPLAFHLLASSDGRASIASVAERMRAAGIELAVEDLLGAFGSLAKQGLIAFVAPAREP